LKQYEKTIFAGHNGHHPQDLHQQHHHQQQQQQQQQQHYLNPYFSSSHSTATGSPTPTGNQTNQVITIKQKTTVKIQFIDWNHPKKMTKVV
jgi:hypothetical protein